MSRHERIHWKHPHLGDIVETVCAPHRNDVLVALRVLGIGSGGTYETEGRRCERCVNDGVLPRVWLRAPR